MRGLLTKLKLSSRLVCGVACSLDRQLCRVKVPLEVSHHGVSESCESFELDVQGAPGAQRIHLVLRFIPGFFTLRSVNQDRLDGIANCFGSVTFHGFPVDAKVYPVPPEVKKDDILGRIVDISCRHRVRTSKHPADNREVSVSVPRFSKLHGAFLAKVEVLLLIDFFHVLVALDRVHKDVALGVIRNKNADVVFQKLHLDFILRFTLRAVERLELRLHVLLTQLLLELHYVLLLFCFCFLGHRKLLFQSENLQFEVFLLIIEHDR